MSNYLQDYVEETTDNQQPTTTTNSRNRVICDIGKRRAGYLQRIQEDYEDIMGRPMPRLLARDVLQMMDDFGERRAYEWLTYALRETAMAPRPSWKYTLAIVNRLMYGGHMNSRKGESVEDTVYRMEDEQRTREQMRASAY